MAYQPILIFYFIVITLPFLNAQKNQDIQSLAGFKEIYAHFEIFSNFDGYNNFEFGPDTLFLDQDYIIKVSDKPVFFDLKYVLLKGINQNEKSHYSDTDYPISPTIKLGEHLIALFEKDGFQCLKLSGFHRDLVLEKKLNNFQFEYHWIFNNKLHALFEQNIYVWQDEQWELAQTYYPFGKQAKLFEDEAFIVTSECRGEFGGVVYFIDKLSNKIYSTSAMCANTVWKENDQYYVLEELRHMLGTTSLISINNPRILSEVDPELLPLSQYRSLLVYNNNYKLVNPIFDYSDIGFLSRFPYQNRAFLIAGRYGHQFIAEVKDNVIQLVYPFSRKYLKVASMNTTQYEDFTLISLSRYYKSEERESSILMIKGNQITQLFWNEIRME